MLRRAHRASALAGSELTVLLFVLKLFGQHYAAVIDCWAALIYNLCIPAGSGFAWLLRGKTGQPVTVPWENDALCIGF